MKDQEPVNVTNRKKNLAEAHKCFVHGTWYENGVGRPRRPFKDPVTKAFEETILALARGKDRNCRSLFKR